MNWKRIIPPTAFFLVGLLFISGTNDYYYGYKPVLMDYDKMVASINLDSPREMENPGKIYVWNKLLFVSEKYLGVHVFDNDNPSSPSNIGFIRIPGNIDIAFYGNYLYADNAIDLITIDISKIKEGNITVTDRQTDIFPELVNPDNFIPWEFLKHNRPANTVIIAWEYR